MTLPAKTPTEDLLAECSLKGVLKRIVFTNSETGYSVCLLDRTHHEETITITGCFPGVQCGETLLVHGKWIEHEKFGKQFQCTSFEAKLPADVHGIRQYLSSGLIHGIGKEYASKIVDYFGESTFQVLNEASARLREVPGIGKKRAEKIKKAWEEQYAIRNTMIFLQAYGITNSQCLRLYQHYGADTKSVISKNPYVIVDAIEGIGFKSADKIALNLGLTIDSTFRIDAGLEYVLSQAESEGNTGASRAYLIQTTASLLEISEHLIEQRLQTLLTTKALSEYPAAQLLQRNRTAIHEACIAKHLQRLYANHSHLPPIHIEKALEWSEAKLNIRWSEVQKNALRSILQSKLSILTGGPGTGKTTLLRALVNILHAKKVRFGLSAPTGRAAQRMTETTGYTARTIHRMLKFEPSIGRFTYDESNRLPIDFLIVDEASMIDISLAHALLRALPEEAHLLWVGDTDQLPSVGAGNVLHDCLKSPYFHVTSLHDIFRQEQRSSIVTVAHRILEGKCKLDAPVCSLETPEHLEEDLHFIPIHSIEHCLPTLKKLYWECLPKWYGVHPIRDVQMLAPMHRGAIGIEQINSTFQQHAGTQRRKMQIGEQTFFVGDKVIQLKNDYNQGIFNGDLGIIQEIHEEDGTITIQFNEETHILERSACLHLKLAYAISIHKSQGSEFPIVILPLFTQHFVMLKRNLLYTAVTRGRKKVFLVGDLRAYSIAVRTLDSTIRRTTLYERLRHSFSEKFS